MRVAWFSPVPPERSGIAAYTAEVVPRLRAAFDIDLYAGSNAHDFVWRHRLAPYDLTVYQLGNAPCHDYMWAYLVRYPGLVVFHDARLHHARAHHLLGEHRPDDYRAEFCYDHPDTTPDAAEYAVEGLSGSLYYFWSMLRVPVTTARLAAVHNARVAADLAAEYPGAAIDTIRMGVPEIAASPAVRDRLRKALGIPGEAVLFAAFGKVTPEKRIGTILDALSALRRSGVNAWLMVVGEVADPAMLAADGVRATGYVPDAEVGAYLTAADACLCLRWPTALETSASWLRCLAAGRATVISNLAHLADLPDDVALRIDLLDELPQLTTAMHRLASDGRLRDDLARRGREHFRAHHSLDMMVADYHRVLTRAASRQPPEVAELPAHFTNDYSALSRRIVDSFGVNVDFLRRP